MGKNEFEHRVSVIRAKLLNIARQFIKMSGSDMDAEDIVQESLTELWLLYESGYTIRNIEVLAVKITKTVCVKHYRKQKILATSIDGKDFTGGTEASEHLEMQESLERKEKLWSYLNQ